MLRDRNTNCFILEHKWEKDCDMEECDKEKCSKCGERCVNSAGIRITIETL